jgi:glycosyltransferase involved in cell wall biosynthesis
LVGDNYDYTTPLPNNVKIVGRLSQQELYNAFLNHEFYLQLSIAEGFPNALAESMLYGCIPIGSNAFGIPGIMDGHGYILAKKNIDNAIEILQTAMHSTNKKNQSIEVHKSIKNRFTFQKRASSLQTLLNKL